MSAPVSKQVRDDAHFAASSGRQVAMVYCRASSPSHHCSAAARLGVDHAQLGLLVWRTRRGRCTGTFCGASACCTTLRITRCTSGQCLAWCAGHGHVDALVACPRPLPWRAPGSPPPGVVAMTTQGYAQPGAARLQSTGLSNFWRGLRVSRTSVRAASSLRPVPFGAADSRASPGSLSSTPTRAVSCSSAEL